MDSFEAADNTAQKQRGRPFEPGKSGNPKGRPKGSKNQATLLAEQLLEGEVEAMFAKLSAQHWRETRLHCGSVLNG